MPNLTLAIQQDRTAHQVRDGGEQETLVPPQSLAVQEMGLTTRNSQVRYNKNKRKAREGMAKTSEKSSFKNMR